MPSQDYMLSQENMSSQVKYASKTWFFTDCLKMGHIYFLTASSIELMDSLIISKPPLIIILFSDDAHFTISKGAAQYSVKHQQVGSGGPKWSVAKRHLQGVNAGHPNKLVHPVDTHGVDNPAPTYRPSSKHWGHGPEKSFGLSRRIKHPEGPGQ